MFLDCIWQLQQQFPSAFEFSEMYLTSLWDTLCLGIFDNFIFDSVHTRKLSAQGGSYSNPRATFVSAWDWSLQFDQENRSLFHNPLYTARTELNMQIPDSHQTDARLGKNMKRAYSLKLANLHNPIPAQNYKVLRPVVAAPMIKLWSHCYLRWITPLQIVNGGSPSEYLKQCLLVEEILYLHHKLNSLKKHNSLTKWARPDSNLVFSAFNAGRAEPENTAAGANAPACDALVTSSYPYNPQGAKQHGNKIGMLVSSFLENSFIQEAEDVNTDE